MPPAGNRGSYVLLGLPVVLPPESEAFPEPLAFAVVEALLSLLLLPLCVGVGLSELCGACDDASLLSEVKVSSVPQKVLNSTHHCCCYCCCYPVVRKEHSLRR